MSRLIPLAGKYANNKFAIKAYDRGIFDLKSCRQKRIVYNFPELINE